MAHAGGRPKGGGKFGGRKAGTPNRVTTARLAIQTEYLMRAIDAAGIPQTKLQDMDPLSVIHFIMVERFRSSDFPGALQAAIALAAYTNARLSSSEVRVTHELATLSDEELHEQALDYERKLTANGVTIDGEAATEQFVANTSA
jgi:hypothetical protein